MPRDELVCVEVTEMEGSPAPAVSSEEPLFRSQDDLITLQGHGGQHTSDLLPGYLAIPCLAITTLVLVNAFAFFLVWL